MHLKKIIEIALSILVNLNDGHGFFYLSTSVAVTAPDLEIGGVKFLCLKWS